MRVSGRGSVERGHVVTKPARVVYAGPQADVAVGTYGEDFASLANTVAPRDSAGGIRDRDVDRQLW